MKLDDATFEKTIRSGWAMPEGPSEAPEADLPLDPMSDDPRLCPLPRSLNCDGTGQCNQGRCPREPIPTEPGDLEETRSSVDSLGFVMAGTVLSCVALWALVAWWLW